MPGRASGWHVAGSLTGTALGLYSRSVTSRNVIGLVAALIASAAVVVSCASFVPPETPSPFRRAPWYLQLEDGTDLQVSVIGAGNDCDKLAGIDVVESDEQVELRAWMEDISEPKGACFAVRGGHSALVKLEAPIGDRELIGCLLGEVHLD